MKENDRDLRCARWMFEMILTIRDRFKRPNFQSWARDIRLMRERDGRTYEEIYQVFRWANNNEFWRVNILSPAKLRKQFDRLALQMEYESGKQKAKKSPPSPHPEARITPPLRRHVPRTGESVSLREAMTGRSKPGEDYYKVLKQFGIQPQPEQQDEELTKKQEPSRPDHQVIRKSGRCYKCGKSVEMLVLFREKSGVFCIDCAQRMYK